MWQLHDPTINTETLDPAIPKGIQIVNKNSVEKKVRVTLGNTFGFGGHNASVVFKEFI